MLYKLCEEKAQKFCPSKCWLEHPLRSEKNRIYFNPRESQGPQYVDPQAYNLFDGLAIKHRDCKDAPTLSPEGPYLQHILKRWCFCDRELNESVLNRFAVQIQNPWVKQGVASFCQWQENLFG
jgi:hypothetical protein